MLKPKTKMVQIRLKPTACRIVEGMLPVINLSHLDNTKAWTDYKKKLNKMYFLINYSS